MFVPGPDVWGGLTLCEGSRLSWSQQEKLRPQCDINIPYSWREEGGIVLYFDLST